LKSSGKLAIICKNLDSFEIIQKISSHLENPDSFEIIRNIGSHLEKSRHFRKNPENWQSSVKIRTVLKSFGKLAVIWKIRTALNHPENWQSSGKIQTVLKASGKLAVIWKNPETFEKIRKIGNHL